MKLLKNDYDTVSMTRVTIIQYKVNVFYAEDCPIKTKLLVQIIETSSYSI